MGWVADLVPDPVVKGFIQGLAWVTILDQVPKLVGVEVTDAPSDFWRRSVAIAGEVAESQRPRRTITTEPVDEPTSAG